MIQLLILSNASNSGSRYFPHSGYLGLSPCVVQGVVHVQQDEQSKSLPAKSLVISVRCYESRLGRVNVLYTNIIVEHSITLWTKPPDVPATEISDCDYPFKIVIPTDSPGFSTANFQDYKLSWRLEAVLEHVPLVGVGSRIVKHVELPLIRYDNPSVPPVPRLSMSSPINLHSAKLRAPIFRYNLSTPTSPIGPEDLVSTIIYLHPVDPLVVVRSASLVIERRIKLNRTFSRHQHPSSPPLDHLQASWSQDLSHYDPYPSDDELTALLPSASNATVTSAAFQSSSSLALSETDSNYTARPLLSHSPGLPIIEPSKIITNTIVSTDAADFAHDSSGMWTKTITVHWPPRKRHSWATGETLTTEMASVRFYIRIRLSVSSPGTGSESIELVERELTVVSTNDSERRLALDHITPRSKSKSPKRMAHEAPEQLSQAAGSKSNSVSKSSAHGPSSSKVKSKTPRRPHTSAGPRDKSNLPYSAAPEVGLSSNPGNKIRLVSSNRNHPPTSDTEFRRDSMRSTRPRQTGEVHPSHIHGRVRIPSDHIRDWEAELARIETVSRRSSADMLGFWGGSKRKTRVETPDRNRSL